MRLHRLLVTASLAACTPAMADLVPIRVNGIVYINDFQFGPMADVPINAPVAFTFLVESNSGVEVRPGLRVGMHCENLRLQLGHVAVTRSTSTVAVFATNGFVRPQDELDMGAVDYSLSGLRFKHEFKVLDGDNASWPSGNITEFPVIPVPGVNFLGMEDIKNWILSGPPGLPGVVNIRLVSIVRTGDCGTGIPPNGDMNADGAPDGDDIQQFTDAIASLSSDPADVCPGDFGGNGIVDADDAPGMAWALLTGMPAPTSGACCYRNGMETPLCVQAASEAECLALEGFGHRYVHGAECDSLDPPCLGGACCFIDSGGALCVRYSGIAHADPAADCGADGGVFMGMGVPCDPLPCPPANDACGASLVIGNGTYAFDLRNATTDGNTLPANCDETHDSPNLLRDLWYDYTATCTGMLQVDTCGSNYMGDTTDTKIAVYAGCACIPTNDTLVACNDNDINYLNACLTLRDSAVRFNAVAGQCYKIRVGTSALAPYGRGILTITCP